jgi:hypothetical protein
MKIAVDDCCCGDCYVTIQPAADCVCGTVTDSDSGSLRDTLSEIGSTPLIGHDWLDDAMQKLEMTYVRRASRSNSQVRKSD